MMKKILSLFLLAGVTASISAQNKKDILLQIDDQPIYAQEFKRVYKKNLDLVQEESQKDVEGYLQLFIDYKLKIAEAKAQGLDKNENYQKEFDQYREQLSRNYLFEDQIIEDMALEAYERGKEEIHAAHILLNVAPDAAPKDTLIAYNKLKDIRERALKGEDFDALAKKYSEEPNAKNSGGDLGYFTVFSMVYPFETEAYNTKEGEVSNIVRSRFGYHLIHVKDRRERLPKISVSHIMISDKKGARNFNPEERAKEILAMLNQGKSFEDLAKEFSDDTNSAVQGGRLKPFTKGELRAPEFENAAYNLTVGEISKPVKTDFGWHIIRLDEKMREESFEEQRQNLERRVAQGDRAKLVTYTVNKKIKEKVGFKRGEEPFVFFKDYLNDSILKRKWTVKPIAKADDKLLFTIGNETLYFSDFAAYLESRQRSMRPFRNLDDLIRSLYEEFETQELKRIFIEKLEKENLEYAAILNEYRDGLLIFDVMEKNIWNEAKNDSIGLQDYFNKHKENYRWKKRMDGNVFAATSQDAATQVKALLEKGKSAEEIKEALNKDGQVNVIVNQGVFEEKQNGLPTAFEIKKGISPIFSSNDSFTIVQVNEVLPEDYKDLKDVKGIVVSGYQNEVEARWMEKLRSKYSVSVNKKTLKRIKKQLR